MRDLVRAIDAASRAVDLEPENRVALFNLALGLHWLGLETEARAAWQRFLNSDSTSEWADEARSHIDKIYELVTAPHLPSQPWIGSMVGLQCELRAYATAAPEEARLYGKYLLGKWGMWIWSQNSVRKQALLRQAGIPSSVLGGQSAILASSVWAVRQPNGSPAAIRSLACAHALYSRSQDALARRDYAMADRFAWAAGAAQSGTALREWAPVPLAATLISQGSIGEAIRVLQQFAAETDTTRYPSLASSIYAQLGTALWRTGRYQQAKHELEKALRLAERIGERHSVARLQLSIAHTESSIGHSDEAYEWVNRALVNLRRSRRATSDALYLTTQLAMHDGLTHAAVQIQSEGLEVTRSGGTNEAEARLSRARALAAIGKSEGALQDAQRAQFYVEAFGTGPSRRTFEAEALLIEADAVLRDQPRRAIILLDSVVRFASGPNQLSAAFAIRAEARIALGEFDSAATDLHRTTGLMEARSAASESLATRVEALYRRLVMQYVNIGRSIEALQLVEQARTQGLLRENRQSTPDLLPPNASPRQVVVDYLLIGDTLLTWTVAGPQVHLTRSTISRQQFSRTIASARLALEFRQSNDVLLPHLQALYAWLIRPIEGHIGAIGTPLVFITDGEIGGVPFSALHDAHRRRYLLEDHSLRFARSLAEAHADRDRATGPEKSLLVVADPAFDLRSYPALQKLPAARVEADSIAMEYSRASLIADVGAHQPALEAGLRRANILHFAGHAFYDPEHPERSSLMLAPKPGVDGSDVLTAEEIGRLDLRHVRLVVLAACETLRSDGRWPDESQGLPGALLTAGAGGVIGSRWRISDDLTRPLMIRFHRAYSASGDGARALRDAQLSFLRSPDPAHRSPAAWAGFEYMGN